MKCLTNSESEELARSLGISFDRNEPTLIGGAPPFSATVKIPFSARGQAVVANWIFDASGDSREWLLWARSWGIWPTEEYREIWNAVRERYGEERFLMESPGHRLDHTERDLARGLFRLTLLFGWDALLIAAPASLVTFVSHDEFLDLYSHDRAALDGLVNDIEAAREKWNNWSPEP
jgi:hypothetical protein